MAFNLQSILLRRLGQAGLIDAGHCTKLAAEKNHQYPTVADFLITEKLLTPQALATAAAGFTMHSLLDLDYYDLDYVPEQERNEKLIRKHQVLPVFKRNRTLFLAVVDPTDMQPVEDFEFSTGLHAELVVVEYDKLHKLTGCLTKNPVTAFLIPIGT
jgi:type IV pilus assembly protein PilB